MLSTASPGSADLRPGSWLGRRSLDLGAGVGAVGLVALLLGAEVTLVDADAQRGLITRNWDKKMLDSVGCRGVYRD